MKDFFNRLGLFFVKILTIALSFLLIIFIAVSLLRKEGEKIPDGIKAEKLNDRYETMRLSLNRHLLDADAYEKELDKAEEEKEKKDRRVFVLNFKGDIAATAVSKLREEITAVLAVATEKDEIILRLESHGGLVHSYGLATSQLLRIKNRKIPLTISVDNIAASGGYMMACVADRLIAAPYAIVGSIGVIVAMPNFHRFLEKHDIDYEQITAGEYKRTLTMFGEITDKGREKVSEQMGNIHELFKKHIVAHRGSVDIEEVATGEYWYAEQAISLNLVDELMTSDDLLLSRVQTADIYEIRYQAGKTLVQRFSSAVRTLFNDVLKDALQTVSGHPGEIRQESLPLYLF